MGVYAGLYSYWQARLSLHGKEWQFGLVESVPDGKAPASPRYLLLRPWAERQRAFHLTSSSPDFCDYTKNLFFGNRAYELDCRYEPGGESPKYKVTFKEQAPRLGELKVTGADLHRLILTAKPAMTVVLDQPAGNSEAPRRELCAGGNLVAERRNRSVTPQRRPGHRGRAAAGQLSSRAGP